MHIHNQKSFINQLVLKLLSVQSTFQTIQAYHDRKVRLKVAKFFLVPVFFNEGDFQ